jgi:phage FluMu protein Com
MQITCASCGKKLKVPDTAAGKKVKCPGCEAVIRIPASEAATAASPPERLPTATSSAADLNLRCPKCDAANVQELPPNAFSRKPGYVCTACSQIMRPAGSTGLYVIALLLGTVSAVIGLGLMFVAVTAERFRGNMIAGAVGVAGLGGFAVVWGLRQMRLPMPVGATAKRMRIWPLIVILVVGLLVVLAAMFGVAYYVHEKM